MKVIIEYCKEEDIEVYMIMMDFEKTYDRTYRITMEKTFRAMNVSETIIGIVKLLYVESEDFVMTNNEKVERLATGGGVR